MLYHLVVVDENRPRSHILVVVLVEPAPIVVFILVEREKIKGFSKSEYSENQRRVIGNARVGYAQQNVDG